MPAITASMLYDFVQCPHRPHMDLHHDPVERDVVNPFVQLLWEKGSLYEEEIVTGLSPDLINLRTQDVSQRAGMTLMAMRRGDRLIYGGRIEADGMVGEPDLLKRIGDAYVPVDIKSGAGEEDDDDDGKPKAHYAVQLALYVDILERIAFSAGRYGYILDIHGNEVAYDLTQPRTKTGKTTLWQDYQTALSKATEIAEGKGNTLPAYCATCKLCHWYSACKRHLIYTNDLSLISELGRAKRDAMMEHLPSISDLAECNVESFIEGKKTIFKGIGPDTLLKLKRRAMLLADPQGIPIIVEPISLPVMPIELFFDIEVDTMRDLCYLHGFIERTNGDNSTERYVSFFMTDITPEAEKQAFADAWAYVRSKQPCLIYYYSKYERTIWRKLQARFPDVCSAQDIEDMFNPSVTIDLYGDVVRSKTEWPTNDKSIKTLAKYLGFGWRDNNPSGAASVQWFDQWVKSQSDEDRQRILDYNEDDCRATRVVLDGLRQIGQELPIVATA